MKFLIEANAFPENEQRFLDTLSDMRIENTIWNPEGRPPYLAADNHVFFYGSIASALALQRVGARFQIWLGKEFDYSHFGGHLNNLLNDDHCMWSYGTLVRTAANYTSILGPPNDDKMYFRSNSGYKQLQGGLYTAKEFLSECKRVNLFKEDLVVISDQRSIDYEYRAVVRSNYDEVADLWDHKVVTSCSYGEKVGPALTPKQIAKIEDDLNTSTYYPYPLWILDLAVSKDEIYQLEANSINCSGLYDLDLKAIINEILDIETKEIQ